MNKEVIYFLFAREFGYTPRQVDAMNAEEVEAFLELLDEQAREKRREVERANRRNKIR